MICYIILKALEDPSSPVEIYGIINKEYDAQLCKVLVINRAWLWEMI